MRADEHPEHGGLRDFRYATEYVHAGGGVQPVRASKNRPELGQRQEERLAEHQWLIFGQSNPVDKDQRQQTQEQQYEQTQKNNSEHSDTSIETWKEPGRNRLDGQVFRIMWKRGELATESLRYRCFHPGKNC